MQITIAYDFLPKQRTTRTSLVMDHFGVGFDQGRHVVAQDVEIKVQPGQVVFFTGPSGSGKSSLLRAVAEQLQQTQGRECVLALDRLELPPKPLADAMPLEVKDSLDLLSACGLSEAQLLLRTPAELSDGQRYRFRLALGIALLEERKTEPKGWLLADEFSAALDRTLAKTVAYNLRRLATRRQLGFLLATTHEDVYQDLSPDVLVQCDLDGRIDVSYQLPTKRAVSFFGSAGSAPAPKPTGRTSLAGTTAAIT